MAEGVVLVEGGDLRDAEVLGQPLDHHLRFLEVGGAEVDDVVQHGVAQELGAGEGADEGHLGLRRHRLRRRRGRRADRADQREDAVLLDQLAGRRGRAAGLVAVVLGHEFQACGPSRRPPCSLPRRPRGCPGACPCRAPKRGRRARRPGRRRCGRRRRAGSAAAARFRGGSARRAGTAGGQGGEERTTAHGDSPVCRAGRMVASAPLARRGRWIAGRPGPSGRIARSGAAARFTRSRPAGRPAPSRRSRPRARPC